MYKKLLPIISVVALFSSCKKDDNGTGSGGTVSGPQITVTAFINNHTAGAKLNNYRLDSGIIKIPTEGTSLLFNYATVSTAIPWTDSLKTPINTTDYPTASYLIGFNDSLFGQKFSIARYYKISATDWTILGDDYGALAITIAGTGTASIPKQAVKKSPSQILATFPINYNDSSKQTCTSSLNFTATIPATPPLPATTGPVTVNQETQVSSKNICWGTLKINGYADSMQTVVQKYTTTVKNTFSSTNPFINAFIPSILSSFGATNGQSATTTTYRFWVPNKGLVMTLNADGSATVTTGL